MPINRQASSFGLNPLTKNQLWNNWEKRLIDRPDRFI